MRLEVIVAFLAIYVIWGSTYLGISIALESMPAFLLTAIRFFLAAFILHFCSRMTGKEKTTLTQWKNSAILGLGLVTLGNGLVVYAEQRIPSSLAALFIPAVPIWLTIFNWRFGERKAPHILTLIGIAFGTFGVLGLTIHSLSKEELSAQPGDILAMLAATLAWAGSTIYARRADLPKSYLQATSMQMLLGSVFLVLLAILHGEFYELNAASWSQRSLGALAYLIVFGSIVAFSCYTFLARTVSPYALGSYAFVNPLIALWLGSYFYNEPVGFETLAAAFAIVLGVAFVLFGGSLQTKRLSMTDIDGGNFDQVAEHANETVLVSSDVVLTELASNTVGETG